MGMFQNYQKGQNVQKPKSSVPKQALSGRDQFLKNTLEDFKEAPLSQKLLGMGPEAIIKRDSN